MLTMTDNARHAVQDIATRAGLPDEGGLRIVQSAEQVGSFELSLVTEPVAGDALIEADGAKVYVEPQTAAVLEDQQLDAAPTADGTGFLLAPQG